MNCANGVETYDKAIDITEHLQPCGCEYPFYLAVRALSAGVHMAGTGIWVMQNGYGALSGHLKQD